jgi:hypothetical protein
MEVATVLPPGVQGEPGTRATLERAEREGSGTAIRSRGIVMNAKGSSGARLALVERFFEGTGPSYDFMVNAATLGIDRLWKRRLVDLIPSNPARVLDLACGTGISTLASPPCQYDLRHLPPRDQ